MRPFANPLEPEHCVVLTELEESEPLAGVPQVTPKSPLVSTVNPVTTCGEVQLDAPRLVNVGPRRPATARVVLVFELPSPQLFSPSSWLESLLWSSSSISTHANVRVPETYRKPPTA